MSSILTECRAAAAFKLISSNVVVKRITNPVLALKMGRGRYNIIQELYQNLSNLNRMQISEQLWRKPGKHKKMQCNFTNCKSLHMLWANLCNLKCLIICGQKSEKKRVKIRLWHFCDASSIQHHIWNYHGGQGIMKW